MKDGGYVMVLVLVVIFGLIAIITVMGRIIVNEYGFATMDQERERAFQIAEAGLDYAALYLNDDDYWTEPPQKLRNYGGINVMDNFKDEIFSGYDIDNYEMRREEVGSGYKVTSEVTFQGRTVKVRGVFVPSTPQILEYALATGGDVNFNKYNQSEGEIDSVFSGGKLPEHQYGSDGHGNNSDFILYEDDVEQDTDDFPSIPDVSDLALQAKDIYDSYHDHEFDDFKPADEFNPDAVYKTDDGDLTFEDDPDDEYILEGSGFLLVEGELKVEGDLEINPGKDPDEAALAIMVSDNILVEGNISGTGFIYCESYFNNNNICTGDSNFTGNIMIKENASPIVEPKTYLYNDPQYVMELIKKYDILSYDDFELDSSGSANEPGSYQLESWEYQ